MSKSIIIDKENYTRTKKKLKKSLEAKGCSFTISEVSDILAQSFGFKNEFDMQKNYFEKLDLKISNSNVNIKDWFQSLNKKRSYIDLNLLKKLLKDTLKGNVIVYGPTNTGKTTIVDYICNKLIFKKIETLEYHIDEDISNNESDLRKHEIYFGKTKYGMSAEPDQKEIRCQSHMDKLLKINNKGYNVVCDLHAADEEDVYQRLDCWGNKNLKIHYLIGVSFVEDKQQIIVHDLVQNKFYKLFDNKIEVY